MIILDTNVISEVARASANPSVLSWLDRHSFAELCITSITAAELLAGVAILPPGRRRTQLRAAVGGILENEFDGRILPFDDAAAVAFAGLFARRRQAGRTVGFADTAIAAIALSAGAQTFVTRNVADFADAGIEVVDPWVA